MKIFYRVETYVVLSGLFSLLVLALMPKLLRRKIFNPATLVSALGFILMICVAGFLIADYTIENRNYVDLTTIGKHAEGTIVDFEHMVDHSRGGRSRDCPIVQFAADDGISRNIAVHDSHCSDWVNKRNLPAHVTVTYLKMKPDVAKVLEWQPAPLVEVRSIGFACLACAAFFLWLCSAL